MGEVSLWRVGELDHRCGRSSGFLTCGMVDAEKREPLKIFGDARSGNCDKVRWTLDYLEIPYDWIEVDSVAGATRTHRFLEINPQGQVPLVSIPGRGNLAQSNAIIRFLAEGTPLRPADEWPAAKVDEWMFWEANNHEPFVAACIAHMTYMGQTKETRDPVKVRRAEEALNVLADHLTGRDWVVGSSVTVADVALLAYTRQAERGGLEIESHPSMKAWIARCGTELKV